MKKKSIISLSLALCLVLSLLPVFRTPAGAAELAEPYAILLQEIRDNIASGKFATAYEGYTEEDVQNSTMSDLAKAWFQCKFEEAGQGGADLQDTMYALLDLNGDGTKELLMTAAVQNLDVIYTIQNGEAVFVYAFPYRSPGDIHGKYMEICKSNTETTGGRYFYELKGTDLVLVTAVEYDHDKGSPAWFQDGQPITEEKADEVTAFYRAGAEPEWCPLLSEAPYFDVVSSDWYAADVAFVSEKSLMTSILPQAFLPEKDATRMQVVSALYALAGSPEAGSYPFTDSTGSSQMDKVVAWAAENQIVNGMGNGTFQPAASVTREQLAAILYRYADHQKLLSEKRADLSGFADAGLVSAWATEALSWANAEELIIGTGDNMLSPKGQTTRGQLAAILHHFCTMINS